MSSSSLYPGAFTIFAGKNMFGWRDKRETELTGPEGGPVKTEWVLTPVKSNGKKD